MSMISELFSLGVPAWKAAQYGGKKAVQKGIREGAKAGVKAGGKYAGKYTGKNIAKGAIKTGKKKAGEAVEAAKRPEAVAHTTAGQITGQSNDGRRGPISGHAARQKNWGTSPTRKKLDQWTKDHAEELALAVNLPFGPLGAAEYILSPKTANAGSMLDESMTYIPNEQGYFMEIPKSHPQAIQYKRQGGPLSGHAARQKNWGTRRDMMGQDVLQAAKTAGEIGAGFIPGVGEAMDARDLYNSASAGDWGGAALAAGALGIGLIPGVGDAAATGLRGLRHADELIPAFKHGFDKDYFDLWKRSAKGLPDLPPKSVGASARFGEFDPSLGGKHVADKTSRLGLPNTAEGRRAAEAIAQDAARVSRGAGEVPGTASRTWYNAQPAEYNPKFDRMSKPQHLVEYGLPTDEVWNKRFPNTPKPKQSPNILTVDPLRGRPGDHRAFSALDENMFVKGTGPGKGKDLRVNQFKRTRAPANRARGGASAIRK